MSNEILIAKAIQIDCGKSVRQKGRNNYPRHRSSSRGGRRHLCPLVRTSVDSSHRRLLLGGDSSLGVFYSVFELFKALTHKNCIRVVRAVAGFEYF